MQKSYTKISTPPHPLPHYILCVQPHCSLNLSDNTTLLEVLSGNSVMHDQLSTNVNISLFINNNNAFIICQCRWPRVCTYTQINASNVLDTNYVMTTVYLLLFYYELCLGRNKYGKQHKYQQSHTDTTVLSYLQDDLTSQIKRMNSTRNAKQVNNASYQTHYVKWSYFTQPISNLNSTLNWKWRQLY